MALYDGSQVLGEQLWHSKNRHTVELAPAVDRMLASCGVVPDDLKALAVAIGPGSFTGLRIGLAMIKGLALGLHIPVIGIPTLEILAAAQPLAEYPLLAVLQAGRGRLAVQKFAVTNGKWSQAGEVSLAHLEDLVEMVVEPILICGELTSTDRTQIKTSIPEALLAPPALSIRRPSYLAELAWQRWQAGSVDDVVTLHPIYLHLKESIEA